MHWLAEIVDGALTTFKRVGRGLVETAARQVPRIIDACERTLRAVAEAVIEVNRPLPKTERERVERELAEVNKRIMRLREHYLQQGSLPMRDQRRLAGLRAEREELNQILKDIDRFQTAEEVVEKRTEFNTTVIDDSTAHILQYHVGQSTDNKICPNCNRAMVLQWQRALQTARVQDFYWGCSGWYKIRLNGMRACKHKLELSPADLNIFANLSRPEFAVSSPELTRVVTEANRTERLRAVLNDILAHHRHKERGILIYRCPLHGETLRFKRRTVHTDILDQYFLGCPHWLPENAGCNYLVKLKSAAQISAVLDTESGDGVIVTSGI